MKSSFSKHLMNCAPSLLSESSAIIRCSSRLMKYASIITPTKVSQLLRDARKGTASMPEPTPCPVMMPTASVKLRRASLLISFMTDLRPRGGFLL